MHPLILYIRPKQQTFCEESHNHLRVAENQDTTDLAEFWINRVKSGKLHHNSFGFLSQNILTRASLGFPDEA